jgi:UDP-N-acetylglucosamine (GlcNAc):hydroxyproline polypeptide GlcNAc-transferase
MELATDQIFVQISAYRDPLLPATLESLFDQAAKPARLRVCLCWQHSRGERLPVRFRRAANVEVLDVDHRRSRGANWARRLVQKRWRGEPYSLIIDSHLRFAAHWDTTLVDLLEARKTAGVRKPVITCYPPDFSPRTFPKQASRVPLKIYTEAYHSGLLVHFAGFKLPLWRWLAEPIPAQFLALGLLFTEGRFNAEIPIDPAIYFFGDEITTGLRAYCHGYDFFHPHRVIAWHAYARKTRTCHWQDHHDWRSRDRRSLGRVRRILKGQQFRDYPLGGARSIADYERYIGMPLILAQERGR